MDDPFVSCPYNPVHRVPRSRIQSHLVRCKDQKPDYIICPYNATHRFPQNDMKQHIINCPSKEPVQLSNLQAQTFNKKPDVKVKQPPSDEEMWDD